MEKEGQGAGGQIGQGKKRDREEDRVTEAKRVMGSRTGAHEYREKQVQRSIRNDRKGQTVGEIKKEQGGEQRN